MRRFVIASGGVLAALAMASVDATAALAAAPAAADRGGVGQSVKNTAIGQKAKKAEKAKKKRYYVAQGPRYNLPTGNLQQQGAIDLYLKKLIRNTPKGSEINVSLFRLQTEGMAKELVTAHRRKVKVRIVLDYDSLNRRKGVYDYLKRNLGTSTRKSSWIVVCPKGRGCIAPAVKGQWSKNHNKFYSFSTTYSSRKVVVQTSGNATGGMYNQYNDSYTSVDAKLYAAYREYFYDLAKRRANGNYYRTHNAGFRAVSYFPKAAGDPIADVLDRVSCAGGKTKIRLSSGMFTRTGVSSRLSKLDDQGCDVRVVSGSLGESTAKALAKPGRNGGPQVRYFTGSQSQRAHSKYLLIDGRYSGKHRRLVLTGSHSYTTDALRHNDESVVTIDHSWTHAQYVKNFDRVFAVAKGRLYVSPWKVTPTVPDNATEPADGEPQTPAAPPEAQLPEEGTNPAPTDGLPTLQGH